MSELGEKLTRSDAATRCDLRARSPDGSNEPAGTSGRVRTTRTG